MKTKPKLTVYFDGLCLLCSREIEHYKKQKGSEQIEFVDICRPGFDASKEGLDPREVHRVMHVRRADGTLATRVEAFVEIWKVLPRYRRLVKFARLPWVAQGLELGYSIFARLRPWLPRRAAAVDCAASPFCEVKK